LDAFKNDKDLMEVSSDVTNAGLRNSKVGFSSEETDQERNGGFESSTRLDESIGSR
jgi:hypothetical protein